MDAWMAGMLSIGAFVAVTALVSLMRRKRDTLLAELTTQAREELQRQRIAEMLEKKNKKRKPPR